jgi:hypothetical protein
MTDFASFQPLNIHAYPNANFPNNSNQIDRLSGSGNSLSKVLSRLRRLDTDSLL